MDLSTVVTVSTLLLMTADGAAAEPGVTEMSLPVQTTSINQNCSCRSAASAAPTAPPLCPTSLAPALGLVTVGWTGDCDGDVQLIQNQRSSAALPVCYSGSASLRILLKLVCQSRRGCAGTPRWEIGTDKPNGYDISGGAARTGGSCETLRVQCTEDAVSDVQLQVYKALTASLCCVLLLLLMIRFCRPTVKALQKRLSDRRQNRWIGPTQSHSVSYHRGKAALKSDDGEKRLSYPALERLTVFDSREPSSNRSSGYNL